MASTIPLTISSVMASLKETANIRIGKKGKEGEDKSVKEGISGGVEPQTDLKSLSMDINARLHAMRTTLELTR
jgi:hypothetical protein